MKGMREGKLRGVGDLSSYVAHGKKTGADKARGNNTKTATQQPKPRARAQRHGPSAATWPERSDMARAQRAPQQQAQDQARGALQPATLKLRRGASPWERSAAAPYWLKFRYRKLENFSYWIKMPFRLFQQETAMKAAVICSILYNAYIF